MRDKLSTQYNSAVQQIKSAILQSQAKALASVNQEQLALYYSIGRYISYNTRKGFWGKGALSAISQQLQAEMPGLRGFGETNLKRMRLFYEEWKALESNSSAVADELQESDSKEITIWQPRLPNLIDIPISAFFNISFTHHTIILAAAKTTEERLFYIQLCSDLHLSKRDLQHKIAQNVYHHQGTIPNNFVETIPEQKQALKAVQMFKDDYLLDFINVEQLGSREEDIDERVLENEIVHNIRNFIMTFGSRDIQNHSATVKRPVAR